MTGATKPPVDESSHGVTDERHIVIVTFDSGQILDVTGPLEVFSSASRFLPAVRYRTQVVTTRGGAVRANCGLEFASSAIGDVVGPVDTLVVAVGPAWTERSPTVSRRRDQAPGSRRPPGHLGLFRRLPARGGRPAPRPSRDHPLGRLPSAGGRLRRDHRGSRRHLRPGRQRLDLRRRDRRHRPGPRPGRRRPRTASRGHRRAPARRLPTASGGQTQYSTLLAGQAADTEPVRDLLSWLRDHLAEDLSLPALARQVNLSERQFTRVFKAQVGVTAADHVEAVRLESACRLLESTNRTIEQIARTCGFGTPETMNRTFRRRLNTTPGDHRHHFRGDIPASHR